MQPTPHAIAADYAARWERAWNTLGAPATGALDTPDSVLIGSSITVGWAEIERLLAAIWAQGWTQISIRMMNARVVGGLVLLAGEFSALGSGANAGKILSGTSSHVLTQVGDTWLSAMHIAVNGAPRPLDA
jgi:hypothetical protein